MILIIAVLAIFLLIACVGLHALNEGVKESHEVAENFKHDWLIEMQHRIKLEAELAERPLPAPQATEESETAAFVRSRQLRPASPETYRNVFDLDINGQRVLDHLELVFANKSNYVRGGQDAERESCFRAGQAHVISFIFKQINKANNPEFYKDEVNDSASE